MAKTMTTEQAQAYLLENTYGRLRVVINDPFYGERNATICNGGSAVMVANLIMDGYEARTGESWEEKVKQSKTKKQ